MSDSFKFRAWNYPVLMANGDVNDVLLQMVVPVPFVALHRLSSLPLAASVSTEWVFFYSWLIYWSLKLLSLPDCKSEQIPLTVQSKREWYQIIKVISYGQPCLLEDVSHSATENMDNSGPLEEHFNPLSSITLLNHQRTLQKNWQWSRILLE